ncbi:MAG: hypothetical protein J6J35_08020 [Alphaproteobacteria bacterium]|nr:hypothetical protein [Alphaproteobacteria bacterium]
MSDLVVIREDGTEVHCQFLGIIDYTKDKAGNEVHYQEDGETVAYTKDKNGNEVHYYKDGKTVCYTKDKKGNEVGYFEDGKTIEHIYNAETKNETWYYKNGNIKSEYNEKTVEQKEYREDGTLEWLEQGVTKDGAGFWWDATKSTEYEADGKTVKHFCEYNSAGGLDGTSFVDGKPVTRVSSSYDDDGRIQTEVTSHYDKGGKLDHWTVERERQAIDEFEDWRVKEPSKTYKREDPNAFLSGDVKGHEWLEANKPEYVDKNGNTVWTKEAKKRQTANALKVQRATTNLMVKGMKEIDKKIAPWMEQAIENMENKTKQKAKTTKAKTKAKVLSNAKANGGRA